MMLEEALLAALIFLAAILYSTVGHAGASGYLAAMALLGVAPETMRPTALMLNILVASLAAWRYSRAGQADWKMLTPIVCASVPMAFLGGIIHVPAEIYRPLVGAVLLASAVQFIRTAHHADSEDAMLRPPSLPVLLALGAALGFLAGLTGTGGGIFLSPVLIFLHWAPTRRVSGIAAGFILLNSIAGLMGYGLQNAALPGGLAVYACCALVGGVIGTQLGSRVLSISAIRRMLGAVLVVAGMKMLLS